jgi:pimeloyl-ACP methyl ester carboxylesterase
LYEHIRSSQKTEKGTILFVMGLGCNSFVWANSFLEPFLHEGYNVIRYDNRCVGASSFVENKNNTKFSLRDMAEDALAVLDAIGVEKVHLIGASMGGMIAQEIGIIQPERVLSLCSMMSTGFSMDKTLPKPSLMMRYRIFWNIIRPRLGNKIHRAVKKKIGTIKIFDPQKIYTFDTEYYKAVAEYEHAHKTQTKISAISQQIKAILRSGSRYEALANLKTPTLIIHGTADNLIPIEHSKKYAPIIPKAKSLFLQDMGHNIPFQYYSEIIQAILQNIEEAMVEY